MRLAPLILMLAGPLYAIQSPPAKPAAQAVIDYTARREAALVPIFQLIQQQNYVAARTAIQPLLATFPHDLRMLYLAADIQRVDGNFDEALALYQQCFALKTTSPGVIHLGIIRTYADMKRWTDFNRERALVRQLALNGDPTLSVDNGYAIEDYRNGSIRFKVLEFPSTDPLATTRFRFFFVNAQKTSLPFLPSIDLESNPADAASFAHRFPREAAAHVRPFALISYPDAHTRAFIKFYPTGEPPYQDVHADVLALAPTFLGPTAPASHPPATPPRPAYKPPSGKTP